MTDDVGANNPTKYKRLTAGVFLDEACRGARGLLAGDLGGREAVEVGVQERAGGAAVARHGIRGNGGEPGGELCSVPLCERLRTLR
jgi:hypothetical protein